MADAAVAASSTPTPTPLPPGLWVLRLKAPFDRAQFPSAASGALRVAARGELAALLQRAAASG